MSEGMGKDIRTIKNIAVFFLVLVIITFALSLGTTIYSWYKLRKEQTDTEAP